MTDLKTIKEIKDQIHEAIARLQDYCKAINNREIKASVDMVDEIQYFLDYIGVDAVTLTKCISEISDFQTKCLKDKNENEK